MYCPTKNDTLASLLALLPRGRAWQNHEGGPEPYRDAPFDPKAFDPLAFDTESRTGSILYRFWEAAADVINFVNVRLCALALEMFCATQNETNDQWMIEYGLPDPCDPFPDLCAKVAAIGGTRCEYFAAIAARAGWIIECTDLIYRCNGFIAGRSLAGRGRAGASPRSLCKLQITVYLKESTAYSGRLTRRPLAGRLRAGQRLQCPPDLTPLQCVLERVVQAHVTIDYQTAA